MRTELARLWDELLSLREGPEGFSVRRVAPGSAVPMYVGVERPSGALVMVVEASRSAFLPLIRWPSSTGFTVVTEPIPKMPKKHRVVIRLSENAYRDVFTALAADTLGAVASVAQPKLAVRALATRLELWQAFFARHGAGALTLEEQRGLHAELLVLRDLVAPHAGALAALKAWTGPLGRDQDFTFPRVTLEVKASLGAPPHTLRISNARQLDETSAVSLHLVHAVLEIDDARGMSLVELVADVRTRFAPVEAPVLDERLVQAGYLDVHAPLYDAFRYALVTMRAYRVTGEFPRIRACDLGVGVSDVRYTISASTCSPYATDLSSIQNLFTPQS